MNLIPASYLLHRQICNLPEYQETTGLQIRLNVKIANPVERQEIRSNEGSDCKSGQANIYRMKKIILFLLMLLPSGLAAEADGIPSLEYKGKSLAGLVGDGKVLVRTAPDGFGSVRGRVLSGQLDPGGNVSVSSFFPGGVNYSFDNGAEILYGAVPELGFFAAVQSSSAVALELSEDCRMNVKEYRGENGKLTLLSEKKTGKKWSLSQLKDSAYRPYRTGLLTDTPDDTLDLAVQFSQYVLDLGYNGEFLLCELFRWLDIWARDLGSGLLSGALVSGRSAQGRQSLQYDLDRYALMTPSYCKNSNDPSQGGTIESIGWTLRSMWNYYMSSGDRKTLESDMAVMRPWVDWWIRRDYDQDGLVIDVTEFMDHMIMMLTTDGVMTLAAGAMYSGMLLYAGKIENELGNGDAAGRYAALYDRTINAINTEYWDEENGYFHNMLLWGEPDCRSAQPAQSMLLKMGATDPVRAASTLDWLKKHNWTEYGSVTIVPKMNHVPLSNDQNVKIWPWWNLWESEARFAYGDPDGGYRLLHLAALTIGHEKYPGLFEETLDLEGESYGGNAFPTGAGNFLDVVVKDLFGIEILSPGWEEVKVMPAVPAEWKDWSVRVPLPGGSFLEVACSRGKLSVTAGEGSPVRTVYTLSDASVSGAEHEVWHSKPAVPAVYSEVEKKMPEPLRAGKPALFYDRDFHGCPAGEFPVTDIVDVAGLETLPDSDTDYLIVRGNSLPLYTRSGVSVKTLIEKFVDRGGYVVFYGAGTGYRTDEDGAGILGEQCGIVDWKQYLPEKRKTYFHGWRSSSPADGDYVYDAEVSIPADFEGQTLTIELGQMTGLDSLFVNGRFVASCTDMLPLMRQEYPTETTYPHRHFYKRLSRSYTVTPEDDAYGAFVFGGENSVEIRIHGDGCMEGLAMKSSPNISVPAEDSGWQYTDEDIPDTGFEYPKRKGINYWGNEQFFNSWSTWQGLFGFNIDGNGFYPVEGTVLESMPDYNIPVTSAYTDFAVFAPMEFEVLAYTNTEMRLLYPKETERFPCAVRVIHGNGGYILIAPELAEGVVGAEILDLVTNGGL